VRLDNQVVHDEWCISRSERNTCPFLFFKGRRGGFPCASLMPIPMTHITYSHHTKHRARGHRRDQTRAEKIVREKILRKDKTWFRFLRQKRIGNYILDFYCSKMMLCIEIDGSSHRWREAYNARRTRFLNSVWIEVIRFKNYQVYRYLDQVERHLSAWISSKVLEG